MSIWESIGLGIVQGLTEFLPVSSSGHLVIAQSFIKGFHQPGVLFDAMVHFGTMLAVLVFFRQDLLGILRACFPEKWASFFGTPHEGELPRESAQKLAGYIVIATIVTGSTGLVFRGLIYSLFESLQTVAIMLVVTGMLLFLSDRVRKGHRGTEDLKITDALVLGLVQACALVPGISRSGATIAAGIFLGLRGEEAARFSFLMAIPAVMGATLIELRHATMVPFETMMVFCVGTIIAAVVGFLTIKLLMFVVSRRNLRFFSYYVWALAFSLFLITIL
ncbi:MAG: undecaprenyl-diphosphate phosphatase [Syntrophales bacterium]|nr:undecaprenyl-diphosphate phosphatase [Syntrophales bacterium]